LGHHRWSTRWGGFQNRDDLVCKYRLDTYKFKRLYDIVSKIVTRYTRTMTVKKIMKNNNRVPEVKTIKHNKTGNYLAIIVKNSKCIISIGTLGRVHHSHVNKPSTPSVRFKINIKRGEFYQKCMKENCKDKKGPTHHIKESYADEIRQETLYNKDFQTALEVV